MTRNLIVLLACAACGNSADPPRAMPYLGGFTASASADVPVLVTDDDEGDTSGIVVVADVASVEGRETVQATYHGGVTVRDRSGAVVASAPGFVGTGSADDLAALATGDAQLGFPIIALAVTSGGHRASETSLVLYAVGAAPRLDQLFSASIEARDGDEILVGSVVFVPGGLVYRAPGAATRTLYRFDERRRVYVEHVIPQPESPPATTGV